MKETGSDRQRQIAKGNCQPYLVINHDITAYTPSGYINCLLFFRELELRGMKALVPLAPPSMGAFGFVEILQYVERVKEYSMIGCFMIGHRLPESMFITRFLPYFGGSFARYIYKGQAEINQSFPKIREAQDEFWKDVNSRISRNQGYLFGEICSADVLVFWQLAFMIRMKGEVIFKGFDHLRPWYMSMCELEYIDEVWPNHWDRSNKLSTTVDNTLEREQKR